MNIICKLFERMDADNIAKSLGNMMISGVENVGRITAYRDLIIHQLNKNRTLLIFQDAVTSEKYSQTKSLITPFEKRIYDISLSSSDNQIDILTAFNTPEDKATFIVTLFGYVADISETLRNKAYRFYYYAIDTFDKLSKPYTLKELAKIDLDYVIDAVNRSSLDDFEKNRRLRFLSDATTYSDFLDFESYMIQLESSGVCRVLSGDKSCDEVFTKGNVSIISGYASEDKKKRELLLNAVMYAVNFCAERSASKHPMSIVLNNMDFMQDEVAKALMEYNFDIDCAVYILMEDISKYIEKNGNELLEKTKSFLVFTQGSENNALFWSAFFGSRDVQERSFSYTRRKGWNPFSRSLNSGGVVATPQKYNSTTVSFQKVNKPIYRPEIFRELRPEEVMCYLREPLLRRKSRI
ncbi:MAG: hypothetical protein J6S23_00590 [Clostridia bacterium]|nr:hypothetical protein [Clostridia bacterium]